MTRQPRTCSTIASRTFQRTIVAFCLGVGLTTWVIGGADDGTPIGSRWWPSEFGAEDQRGAANRITPKKVLEARDLIQAGKIYQLGRLYEHGMPIPGKRHFSLTIPGLPTGLPTGNNQMVSNDELVSGEIGQIRMARCASPSTSASSTTDR